MPEENISDKEWDDANERGREMMRTLPRANAAVFHPNLHQIQVDLNVGYSLIFRPERVQDLKDATADELSEIEVSFPGFSIYFPRLDVDLWIPNLAKGRFGNDAWEAQWAALREPSLAA